MRVNTGLTTELITVICKVVHVLLHTLLSTTFINVVIPHLCVLRFVCTVLYENRSAEHYAHICIFRRDFDRRIPGHSVKEGWREMFRVLCCVDSGFDIRAHQVPQMLKKTFRN